MKKIYNTVKPHKLMFVFICMVFIFSSLLVQNVFACKGSKCSSRSGSAAGSCPGNCNGGVCWVDSRESYCPGHNYSGDVAGSSTTKTEASRSKVSETWSEWSSREKIDNSSSKHTRIRTETWSVTYNTTTTTTYNNTCSICGHTFTSTETSSGTATETVVEEHTETEYSIRGYVNVYLQNTHGGFDLNVEESEANAGAWSGWCGNINDCRVGFSWSRNITSTHYASNTHTSGSQVDTNINTTCTSSNREWNRYIYRKRYWLRLHPNKQSNTSTNIVNQTVTGYSIPTGQIYQQRACYVDETFFVPKTYSTFQMYGYASYNTWYTAPTGGTARGEGKNMNLVGALEGYGNPDSSTWYVVDFYARWYSEPGGIYLMPNSSSVGTDSCYGAYIDDGHEDTTEQADTYLFEKRESDVGLGNTSRP